MSKNQLADKAKRPRNNVPLSLQRDKIAELITKYYGNVSRVADALGANRHPMDNYIKSDPELKRILEQARERTVDELEDAAMNQALNGSPVMTIFLLKTRGRGRGYEQAWDKRPEDIAEAAFKFIQNKSKNPAEIDNNSVDSV